MNKVYAQNSWCVEDIKTLKPQWTTEQCENFLSENEDNITEAMTSAGWQVIEDLIK